MADADGTTFLAPGEPVDLDNCAREPIHVPGSIQPRGVFLAVTEPDLVVRHTSQNVAELLGHPVDDVLGHPLEHVLGAEAAGAIEHHVRTWGNLRARNPLVVTVGDVELDVVLHRILSGESTLLIVELEPASGPRPFSFPNTYQAVRGAVEQLNHAHDLAQLYEITAREVRALTGFDRVMIYRFDDEYNGEVVAEAKRPDLNPFLGLHYPASDIPPQARALYEQNWVRLISDVGYTPSRIVPGLDEETGLPLDLTHSILRSVSPIHLEYLGNMGVAASMSISLLRDGRLWGLIACHHYSGPHDPPFGVRAAAEFLGSTPVAAPGGTRRGGRARGPHPRGGDAVAAADAPAGTTTARWRRPWSAGRRCSTSSRRRARSSSADGVVDSVGRGARRPDGAARLGGGAGRRGRRARSPWPSRSPRWRRRSRSSPACSRCGCPTARPSCGSGTRRCTTWTGAATRTTRRSPRARATTCASARASRSRCWRETVRGRSEPWTEREVRSAEELRARLLEVLLERSQLQVRAAETVQRSLLPSSVPDPEGWSVHARYEPAAGGRVGGDWYDALVLPGRPARGGGRRRRRARAVGRGGDGADPQRAAGVPPAR